MSKKLLLFACACCMLIQAKELVITSRVQVDDKSQDAVWKELQDDSRALTRKYAEADGVRSVETSVETRCDVCGISEKTDTRCNCGGGKPRPKSEDSGNIAQDEDATKCNCGGGKPKPKSQDAAQCTECQDHTQAADKVARNEAGEEICSDCQDTLRSCSSCCKKKCCKKCKKCCNKCCSSSSSSTCCH